MSVTAINDPTWLRAQSARCRAMAETRPFPNLERFLLGPAQAYEADASNLEPAAGLARIH